MLANELIVFTVIRLSSPALQSFYEFSPGRLNERHCECYEWTKKLEVNKSCAHAVPPLCNPAVEGGCLWSWNMELSGRGTKQQREDTVTQPATVAEMWLNCFRLPYACYVFASTPAWIKEYLDHFLEYPATIAEQWKTGQSLQKLRHQET